MKGDFHVRFCGNVGVKFPRVTRLCASGDSVSSSEYRIEKRVQPDNTVDKDRKRQSESKTASK